MQDGAWYRQHPPGGAGETCCQEQKACLVYKSNRIILNDIDWIDDRLL